MIDEERVNLEKLVDRYEVLDLITDDDETFPNDRREYDLIKVIFKGVIHEIGHNEKMWQKIKHLKELKKGDIVLIKEEQAICVISIERTNAWSYSSDYEETALEYDKILPPSGKEAYDIGYLVVTEDKKGHIDIGCENQGHSSFDKIDILKLNDNGKELLLGLSLYRTQ